MMVIKGNKLGKRSLELSVFTRTELYSAWGCANSATRMLEMRSGPSLASTPILPTSLMDCAKHATSKAKNLLETRPILLSQICRGVQAHRCLP